MCYTGIMGINIINALLVERLSYERRGLHERAALVTEALHNLGYVESNDVVETATVEPPVERSVKRRAKKRDV